MFQSQSFYSNQWTSLNKKSLLRVWKFLANLSFNSKIRAECSSNSIKLLQKTFMGESWINFKSKISIKKSNKTVFTQWLSSWLCPTCCSNRIKLIRLSWFLLKDSTMSLPERQVWKVWHLWPKIQLIWSSFKTFITWSHSSSTFFIKLSDKFSSIPSRQS